MLQEIVDRILEPGKSLVDKIRGLLYEATYGLVLDYQKKTLELVRISAASCYLQGAKVLRKAAVLLFLVTMASVVFSVAVVVVPVAIVLVCPLTALQKIAVILVLGITDGAMAFVILLHLFSEERWMKITKAQEFVDKVMQS